MMPGRALWAACFAVTVGVVAMPEPVRADTVSLFAAGSLRAALTDVAKAYETQSGHRVQMKFGPSGILKDEIAGGAKADVFASANMEHPQALHAAGKSGPVVLFARNRLCALVKPGLKVDSASLLERMLDPQIKLGTSTPKADPSGDYAFEVFRKAEALKPDARAGLEKKALQLTGNPSSAQPPQGRAVYGWHVAEGRADIFLAYCTATREAKAQNPDQQIVELPASLSVSADYGLTAISGAANPAQGFAQFVVSPAGQKILAGYGFAPGQP
jgi:ABC-type molybdate transport system substrate-binding protein